MISNTQLRTARALLHISQKEVAENTELSIGTLTNIENDTAAPNTTSAATLAAFYESCGIEFGPYDGVRRNPHDPIYEGSAGFRRFFDDVYATAKNEGGDICLLNGVPSLLIHWLGEDWYAMHAERMSAIQDNFTFRVIIKEQDKNLIGKSFVTYRWFPEDLFEDQTVYTYGDKVAHIKFSDTNVIADVKRDAKNAKTNRVLFDIAWHHVAKEIDP